MPKNFFSQHWEQDFQYCDVNYCSVIFYCDPDTNALHVYILFFINIYIIEHIQKIYIINYSKYWFSSSKYTLLKNCVTLQQHKCALGKTIKINIHINKLRP